MTTDQNRRIDLDWIRIAAFGLLILYHVGMLYVPWTFHVKSAHAGPGPEPLMLALNPWRLSLLFLISGVASRFMLEKVAAASFARQRSWRLLVPLLFGMLIIVPPQSYFEVVEKYGFAGSFLHFYGADYLGLMHLYRTPSGQVTGLILPTWNHLWFVIYLLVYTLLVASLAASPRILTALDRFVAHHATPLRLLIAPCLLLIAFALLLRPRFPVTHALFDDWYGHALYGSAFFAGFLLARVERAWDAIDRLRWPALALTIASYAVFVGLTGQQDTAIKVVRGVAYGIDQWCAIIAILGFGRRLLPRKDGPVRRYLTDAVFPYYIVHQTALIALAVYLKPYALSAGSEFALVVLGTALACAITYEIVRRAPPLRVPFGLRGRQAKSISDAEVKRGALPPPARGRVGEGFSFVASKTK